MYISSGRSCQTAKHVDPGAGPEGNQKGAHEYIPEPILDIQCI